MSKVKKVILIEPKSPTYHVYSRVALPRLGLPLLGTMLKQQGLEVRVYCEEFQELDYDDILSSDLVGISTTTSTAPSAYKIAQRAREAGVPTVVGGSHVSFMAEEALQYADFCVRGEGEYTFPELIEAIDSGSGFSEIKGLSYKIGDEARHNEDRGFVQDLDSLPFVDLSVLRGREKVKITPIATSRGCPFGCNFCSVIHMFGRKYRERSVENVVEEILYAKSNYIFFYDDNFAADAERTKLLLETMIRRGAAPAWSAQVRAEVAHDKELLRLMKRSNCCMVYMGLESVNPETLKEYNKRQSVDDIAEAVRAFRDHEILTHGMFVFGAENDDAQSLRGSLNFAIKNNIDTVQFMVLTPFPGTPYYDEMVEQGRLLTNEWHFYDGQHVVYHPNKMSPYELQKETIRSMKRFYSLSECAKMLLGVDFLKFAAKFNLNLLAGRWTSARRQLDARVMRWMYRTYGHFLLRRWEAANKDFGERIKALAEKAREVSKRRQPSPEKLG